MSKYEVTVSVQFKFEIEEENLSYKEALEKAEDHWTILQDIGLADEQFHDTEFEVREI